MSNSPRRRLRAPQADGAALIDPPLSQVAALVAANRAAAVNRDAELGLPPGFCKSARRGLLGGVFGNEPGAAEINVDRPFILAGHQPTLFHPGVWFKNFLLSSIAKHVGGQAVNLIVDNDTIRTASIKVPTGGAGEPPIVEVPFDAHDHEIPWERRYLLEPELLRTFDRRVHETLPARERRPLLLDHLWPCVMHAGMDEIEACRRLFRQAGLDESRYPLSTLVRPGQVLAAGRHKVERDFGLTTHEASISDLAFFLRFLQLAEVLIRRHVDLCEVYNAALRDYRQANHVRSRSHPVPELERDGDWYEVPLWLWSHERPERRRAFARRVGDSWKLTDRQGIVITPETLEPSNKMTALEDAEIRRGISVRPRALLTTMYARLVLSDLFIHGIGGAKYDELTDEIIRRFFGIEPPAYLTATATFRLPIVRPQVTEDDVRKCASRVRNLRYRPESFVSDPLLVREPAIKTRLEELAQEKRAYLAAHRLRRGTADEFRGLDQINRAMHDLLRPVEEHLRREHARLIEEARRARLLGSREFSFVLFPEEYLVPRLLELSQVPA